MHCQPSAATKVYKWLETDQICLLCDEVSGNPYALCEACECDLPWLEEQCTVCALPLAMSGFTCAPCRRRPPAFGKVETPWHYGFPVDSLITRFKHNSQWLYGRLLAELTSHWLDHRFNEGLPRPQLLIPVPMGRKRLRRRGFNQAEMLARWLSEALHIDCDSSLVQRPRETRAQQELGAKARLHNLERAFALMPGAVLDGVHVALVDDVMTTGATAQALATLLREGGAARVDVYCLARTAKPE
ncbi:hypothetical protein AHFPHNDE_00389 [Pseudomonas sp. MM227]|uniref:ComF family protein n=1 Tax=Pseudomonas sp. MM227 TaxID=3019968 RepID=UPI00221E5EFC|nr:ComF family protein [Pseudomonas sp. MM227]CAI3786750.1 hypothetical protein AHFPHNDE_00389 [Pseudomonas sp. MM227]